MHAGAFGRVTTDQWRSITFLLHFILMFFFCPHCTAENIHFAVTGLIICIWAEILNPLKEKWREKKKRLHCRPLRTGCKRPRQPQIFSVFFTNEKSDLPSVWTVWAVGDVSWFHQSNWLTTRWQELWSHPHVYKLSPYVEYISESQHYFKATYTGRPNQVTRAAASQLPYLHSHDNTTGHMSHLVHHPIRSPPQLCNLLQVIGFHHKVLTRGGGCYIHRKIANK